MMGSNQFVRPADDTRCPYCKEPFPKGHPGTSHPRRRTQDHILPQAWGGTNQLHGTSTDPGTSNIRIVCAQCNERRGQAGHCAAAMLCVLDVARTSRRAYTDVWRQWRMRAVASLIVPPALARRR